MRTSNSRGTTVRCASGCEYARYGARLEIGESRVSSTTPTISIWAARADATPNRLAPVTEVSGGQRPVDDGDAVRVRPVCLSQRASSKKRDTDRREVPGSDGVDAEGHDFVTARLVSLDVIPIFERASALQSAHRERRRFDSGNARDLVEHTPVDCGPILRRPSGKPRIDTNREHACGLEAEIDTEQLLEAAREQASPRDEQGDGAT